jgi:hypothetical protein
VLLVKQAVDELVNAVGNVIMSECIESIAHRAPRTAIQYISDVLYQLCTRYVEVGRHWLRSALAMSLPSSPIHPTLSSRVSQNITRLSLMERENFCKQLLSTRHQRRFKDAVKEMTIKCRGLDGTAFGHAF